MSMITVPCSQVTIALHGFPEAIPRRISALEAYSVGIVMAENLIKAWDSVEEWRDDSYHSINKELRNIREQYYYCSVSSPEREIQAAKVYMNAFEKFRDQLITSFPSKKFWNPSFRSETELWKIFRSRPSMYLGGHSWQQAKWAIYGFYIAVDYWKLSNQRDPRTYCLDFMRQYSMGDLSAGLYSWMERIELHAINQGKDPLEIALGR